MVPLFFFFQAEDGIRDVAVTGVQTCALPISWLRSRGGPRRCAATPWARCAGRRSGLASSRSHGCAVPPAGPDRKSGVEGKRGDLGGRRIIKKKKKNRKTAQNSCTEQYWPALM